MSAVMLAAGDGEYFDGLGAVDKATMEQVAYTSSFDVTVPPGYDVGAHVHARLQPNPPP